jgi:uncharacterized membrane protein
MTAFVWQEHISEILWTSLLSMVPAFEGRYAISVGMNMGMPIVFTYFLALVMSTVPMFFILWLVRPVLRLLHKTGVKFLDRFATWVELRGERGAAQVSRRGLLGLFLFVAVPLPGTGVWTGTFISVLLGYDAKRSMLAVFLGNVAACLIMTLLTYGVISFLR